MEDVRIYRHPNPGYTLTLWLDGKPIKQGRNGKSNAVFKDTGKSEDRCGIFRTSEDAICKAIEQSKGFRLGHIIKLASAKDIQMESLKKKRLQQQESTVNLVKEGLFNLDALESYKADKLKIFAEGIGVAIKTDKGMDRTKADVMNDVKDILFPGSVDESKSSDDDKEEIEE